MEGHQIGQSQLLLEVVTGGIVLARDIVPIHVNVFMKPSKPICIHVGDMVHFSVPEKIGSEKWTSGNNDIVKINYHSGEALASKVGETHIKYGVMSTRVSVVKLSEIVKSNSEILDNGYSYELLYEGNYYPNSEDDNKYIDRLTKFKCEVLGKEGQYLRGVVVGPNQQNGKEFVKCIVEKIPGTATIQTPVNVLKLRLIA